MSPNRKASLARYNASPKGRASPDRYNASERGRARYVRYNASKKGVERHERWYQGLGRMEYMFRDTLASNRRRGAADAALNAKKAELYPDFGWGSLLPLSPELRAMAADPDFWEKSRAQTVAYYTSGFRAVEIARERAVRLAGGAHIKVNRHSRLTDSRPAVSSDEAVKPSEPA